MRVLHFSDIHLRAPWRAVPWSDWLGKRIFAGLNLALGRARKFDGARRKVAALDALRRAQDIGLVLFTGDYTAMGTDAEFRMARASVAPLVEAPRGYCHVPGNHDLYLSDVIRQRRFDRHFGDLASTDCPEFAVEAGLWPYVRFIGQDAVVVGVNSARPNAAPWRSNGAIPEAQLDALARILKASAIRERFVFLITHYPPCLEGGRPDSASHGLVNAERLLAVCAGIDRGAVLCGHVHRRYTVRLTGLAAPICCAGSATASGSESFWMYELAQGKCRALAGVWAQNRYELDHGAGFTL